MRNDLRTKRVEVDASYPGHVFTRWMMEIDPLGRCILSLCRVQDERRAHVKEELATAKFWVLSDTKNEVYSRKCLVRGCTNIADESQPDSDLVYVVRYDQFYTLQDAVERKKVHESDIERVSHKH
jgi:hypothetical protein